MPTDVGTPMMRQISIQYSNVARRLLWATLAVVAGLFAALEVQVVARADDMTGTVGRLMTMYDRGIEQVFVTDAGTVGDALAQAGVVLDEQDVVEPGRMTELVASEYTINIYRARPIIVVDGAVRKSVMTPYRTAEQITAEADIVLYDEDITTIGRIDDVLTHGPGLQLVIDRAAPFTFTLHGNTFTARTQATTVGNMLQEKGITLGEHDRVSVVLSTAITEGMTVRVWREGRQTITVNEAVAYETEQIWDINREVGYRAVQTPGREGERAVTYEVMIQEGEELERREIASVTTKQPTKEGIVIGAKPSANPLTAAKGAHHFTDSNGVVHRETYYDLPMAIVMGSCGAGGFYTVRSDGAKVDKDGYVIVAAHLGNYPRCTVVETSLGLGKVYDTGGFAARHPHGFDLATDWTNNNGI